MPEIKDFDINVFNLFFFKECFPARVKAIHLINQPWYINATVKTLTPFLKTKIGDRVRYEHILIKKYISPLNTPHHFLP